MFIAKSLPKDYWKAPQVTTQDVEYLHTYLFERETPLTSQELVGAFVQHRIQSEAEADDAGKVAELKTYLPREKYGPGDVLVFPALDSRRGTVSAIRKGVNPAVGDFDVISVTMFDGGDRQFAAGLENHRLNNPPEETAEPAESLADETVRLHGSQIAAELEQAFKSDASLVQIAGRWFPRSLLVGVNVGHLNLAEAALDMAGGEPLPTASLLKDVALPEGENPKLAEFSLNLALQEDERFDEVGPAGEILWCLRRLEPDSVRAVPIWLRYAPLEHDRSALTAEMLVLEGQLNDELSPSNAASEEAASLTVALIYPHLRAGTLPVPARARNLFPTAYESPRVRFTLVDGKTGQKMPGWVVRKEGYVYGLREWFKAHALMPGSLVDVRHGLRPGEVIVEARTQRASKDWVRTLMIGADGGMVFAMLKQPITAEFNDRMAIHVPDFKPLDPLWEKPRPFEEQVVNVLREMTKVNAQGHVHAQELYAAVNLVRRVPPAPLLALLGESPRFKHVGDLHYRLEEAQA